MEDLHSLSVNVERRPFADDIAYRLSQPHMPKPQHSSTDKGAVLSPEDLAHVSFHRRVKSSGLYSIDAFFYSMYHL